MASLERTRDPGGGVGQLWQFPLLLLSIGLFGYAAWVFIDPKPGLSIDQKVDAARQMLKAERPEAAIEQLNRIVTAEKLDPDHEAQVHTLLAGGLDQLQQLRHLNLRTYREQIIDQTRMAEEAGAHLTSESERRLGESYEALAKPAAALAHYRQAMALDPAHSVRLQRKVIELQLAQNDVGPATASLDAYLHTAGLSDAERAWGLCNRAKLLVDAGEFTRAKGLLDDALHLDADPVNQGQVNYYLGYCADKLGDLDGADRLLRVSREQLRSDHPLDARAALLLGKVWQAKNDPKQAASFYQDVLVSHPGCDSSLAALLGRGVCRLAAGMDEAGLTDLRDLARQIAGGAGRPADKAEAVAALSRGSADLSGRGNQRGALELLEDEQQLEPTPTAAFFGRLAGVIEQRAEQVERSPADDETAADAVRRAKLVRDLYTRAGDASVAYAKLKTASDDKAYGDALWHGIDLYDRAGNMPAATAALELFVAEKPDDPLAPEALLRLGKAYQAMGNFDRAISAFQRNQYRYPNSLAASKSAVPLAEAYLAKGPEFTGRAEAVLRGVVENNPLLSPDAAEFRQALFELAQLYYRTGKYEEAVARLAEMTARYPDDDRQGQLLFLMADSYRKSAGLLAPADKPAATLASISTMVPAVTVDAAEATIARRDRLTRARDAFAGVVAGYQKTPPKSPLDKLYKKLSYFYVADCTYDLGDYPTAIGLYEDAASRYENDPASLGARVQVVNANYALGRPAEARAATERAKVELKLMPPEAFTNGTFAMPKEYWENQLNWAGTK